MKPIDSNKNVWSNYDYPVLTYNIYLEIEQSSAINIVDQFSKEFLVLSHKYGFLLNSDKSLFDLLQYYNNKKDEINKLGKHIPSLLDIYALSNEPGGPAIYVNKMHFWGLEGLEYAFVLELAKYLRKYEVSPFVSYSPDDINNNKYYPFYPLDCNGLKPKIVLDQSIVNFSFRIASYLSIWFETTRTSEGVFHDNKILAYRNTPRLNSFLRDLRQLVDKYGCKWEFESEGKLLHYNYRWDYSFPFESVYNDHCIPLDGKIIYQEDIDEGRITLPPVAS
ncbi:hypothetical protein [Lewinella sp. LCG006]|uniref:hypothetical protein n=1 Tax=Lewinella sp. LCG006 TaxID=3231911 RepID=UPI00346104AE